MARQKLVFQTQMDPARKWRIARWLIALIVFLDVVPVMILAGWTANPTPPDPVWSVAFLIAVPFLIPPTLFVIGRNVRGRTVWIHDVAIAIRFRGSKRATTRMRWDKIHQVKLGGDEIRLESKKPWLMVFTSGRPTRVHGLLVLNQRDFLRKDWEELSKAVRQHLASSFSVSTLTPEELAFQKTQQFPGRAFIVRIGKLVGMVVGGLGLSALVALGLTLIPAGPFLFGIPAGAIALLVVISWAKHIRRRDRKNWLQRRATGSPPARA